MSALLSIGADAKTPKGETVGYRTAVLYMQPGNLSGVELCPGRSSSCFRDCIAETGRMPMPSAKLARAKRTALFLSDGGAFASQLYREIDSFASSCAKSGLTPAVRPNGTTDVNWEKVLPGLFTRFPEIQFYDYTKVFHRARRFAEGRMPSNYDLTFSRSETNARAVNRALALGVRIALVYRGARPATWHGFECVDGDASDLRFRDPMPSVVCLKAKGPARRDESGFVLGF